MTSAAITRRSFRQVGVAAAVCGLVFGATAASSALTYVSSFPTQASRDLLVVSTSSDRGLAVLLGPVASIGTVGGYTFYKGYVFLTTIGAVWALLATNRLLRGEEDEGRWQLVLSGATRPTRATGAVLAALAGAIGVVVVGTALPLALAGRDPSLGFGVAESALYGLSIAAPTAAFAAVGAVTSQLGRTRRVANGVGMGVLAVAFVVRMVADSGGGTRWLLWATPFGWPERIAPLTENDPWPLAVAALVTLALCGLAVALSGRRDVGAGVLASRDVGAPRPFGLRSTLGLAVRLEGPSLGAWGVGAAAAGLSLGFLSKLTTAKIPASFGNTLDRFGVQGSFARQYFGVSFLLIAAVVALIPAGQLGAAADDEASGRLAVVLAGTVRRRTWFVERLALAAVAVVAAGLLAGVGAWLGAAGQGVPVGFGSLVGAGLNVVPVALVALGVGAVVLAVAPRAASAAVYALVAWSLIIDLVASMVGSLGWMGRLSLFHYLRLVPAQPIDPEGLVVTTAVSVGLCGVATLLFGRRDLPGG